MATEDGRLGVDTGSATVVASAAARAGSGPLEAFLEIRATAMAAAAAISAAKMGTQLLDLEFATLPPLF